ncbi:MAG: hypothetical protein R3E58_13400 [Phycisphaerae bacterium]
MIVKQEIVKAENRINMLLGRFPGRSSVEVNFMDLNIDALSVGFHRTCFKIAPTSAEPSLKWSRAGLDVKSADAGSSQGKTDGGVGYEAYNARFLLDTPESLAWNIAGGITAPLINRKAIEAEYLTANARQLSAIYEYQRTVLNAFIEVVNRVSMVQNFRQSIAASSSNSIA